MDDIITVPLSQDTSAAAAAAVNIWGEMVLRRACPRAGERQACLTAGGSVPARPCARQQARGSRAHRSCFSFPALPCPSPTFLSWPCWALPSPRAQERGQLCAECPGVVTLGMEQSSWRHRRVPSWGGAVTSQSVHGPRTEAVPDLQGSAGTGLSASAGAVL